MRPMLLLALFAVAGLTVNEFDNNRTIHLDAGQVLVVRLMVPKGARDAWQVSRINYGVLKPAGRSLEGPGREPGTDVQVLRFKAVGSGQTTLELRYNRPVEKGYNPPFRTYRITSVIAS